MTGKPQSPAPSASRPAHVARLPDFRNLGVMLWRLAFARAPAADERAEFEALWRGLPDDGYSANRALHRLIDTNTFQVP